MTARVIHGDARTLPLASSTVDAIVTDPPYELGFMGRQWDRSGVAYDVATWREAMRVLKPGGHLLAFGGTRTSHRLTVAIEDAGFEVRDSIVWLYGSGFPKSLDVSKAIDKAAGAERAVIGAYAVTRDLARNGRTGDEAISPVAVVGTTVNVTAPTTDDAAHWQGWGTALKPAHEPTVVARKPLAGTVAANVLAYGTGAINVDGCRVGTDVIAAHGGGRNGAGRTYALGAGIPAIERGSNPHEGRWPANVVLSHASTVDGGDACADGCVDGCPVAELDAQSVGTRAAKPSKTGSDHGGGIWGSGHARTVPTYGDGGGASRFFPVFRYQAKAPSRERPRVNGVSHPTVKPLALMRWLVRLVTPPDGLVLDPFCGSGTTLEAALLEGFPAIGVERDATYLPLIETRLARADG